MRTPWVEPNVNVTVGDVVGRALLIQELMSHVESGHTVLLYGPYGIGKTAILLQVRERLRKSREPCAFASRTQTLADVTRALADVYAAPCGSARALRSRLQLAIEAHPGALLLDDVKSAGAALKGFLRRLDGTGLGVVLAANAENDRDHAALRAMRLAYREVRVPGLASRHMRRILELSVAEFTPAAISPHDSSALLEIAAGRPGILRFLVSRLSDVRFWNGAALRLEMLRSEAAIETGRAYIAA